MCLTNSVSYNGCSRIPEVCASLVYHVTNTFSLPFFLCFCLVMTIKEVLNKWDELKNQICYFCCYGFHSDMARSLINLVQHIVVIEFTHLKKFSNISMVISLSNSLNYWLIAHIWMHIYDKHSVIYIDNKGKSEIVQHQSECSNCSNQLVSDNVELVSISEG